MPRARRGLIDVPGREPQRSCKMFRAGHSKFKYFKSLMEPAAAFPWAKTAFWDIYEKLLSYKVGRKPPERHAIC